MRSELRRISKACGPELTLNSLHPAERERFDDAFAHLFQGSSSVLRRWQPRERILGVLIEFHDCAIRWFFERMPNDGAGDVRS